MTPADLLKLAERVGSLAELARRLDYHPNYLYRLARGEAPICRRFARTCQLVFPERAD